MKVRCEPVVVGEAGNQPRQCQRCAASGKECIYTEPRRTRRKRTDVRVRELEREVKTLNELCRRGISSLSPMAPPEPLLNQKGCLPIGTRSTASDRRSSKTPDLLDGSPYELDPIDAGILSMQEAAQLFSRYVVELVPQRPFVVFPADIRPEVVHSSSPILFLAVVAASAATVDDVLAIRLNDLVRAAYARSVMIKGEKSLELVQALLITANWYYATETWDYLKFYQYLNMAATMAVEIDLERQTSSVDMQKSWEKDSLSTSCQDRLACHRTLLACYICCSR